MLHCCDLWTLCFCFRDVMSLGISLVGHQKKIMSSIQTMRAQMLHLHGTGIQVWWTSEDLPGRMNQNSPRNAAKCVTRQKIWKNKSTTKKKKIVTHPSGEIKLPELAEQNHSFVIGEGFWRKCWKPGDGEKMKKQTCEREKTTWTATSGCSEELFTSLSWSVQEDFYALYGLSLSSQKVDLLIVARDFTGFFF